MRHRMKGRHLGRSAEHRKALSRNLVRALFEHGRIHTTDAKAREVQPLAERMITLGKRGSLHARRQALRVVGRGPALERLFGPIAERFAGRAGGYTRMIKAGRRHGDAAPTAFLELLEEAPRAASAPTGAEGGGKERRRRGKQAADAESRAPAPKARASAKGEAAGKGKPTRKAKSGEGRDTRAAGSESSKKSSGRSSKREAPG